MLRRFADYLSMCNHPVKGRRLMLTLTSRSPHRRSYGCTRDHRARRHVFALRAWQFEMSTMQIDIREVDDRSDTGIDTCGFSLQQRCR